jgi:hypothetical protein
VLDGRGGKRSLGNVELSIVEEQVSGGSVSYSNKASDSADDTDGDGVENDEDAFPNDPAASVDTDGDGMPDDWNDGKSAADSTSDPVLVRDNDDDNDGLSDRVDSYPLDSNLPENFQPPLEWIPKGEKLVGDEFTGHFGALAINRDGTVIARGAIQSTINGEDSGAIRVEQWNGIAWEQRGEQFLGIAGTQRHRVALSALGEVLVPATVCPEVTTV